MEFNTKNIMGLSMLVSLICFFLVIVSDIGGFYLTGPYEGYRYSCLTCDYGGIFEKLIIVVNALLFLSLGVISLNIYMDHRFFKKDFSKLAFIILGVIIILTIAAGFSFASEYSEYEWWFATGFYANIIGSLIISILFFIAIKRKE